ncbi:NACHT, LRR and PYD domains-containing protein 3-like [Trichomycterus rosablanca]|uniref:NACHT, LRR and PYD domains-containing protein 3-like n=1 Tax=Trichomycterus rosablanca TaxID=2290929 RepID=UPI002F35AB0E
MEGTKPDSPQPSCVSMKSDQSIDPPQNFKDGGCFTDLRTQKKKLNVTYQLESIFKELELKVISMLKNELNKFKKLLNEDYPACSEQEVKDVEDLSSFREGALKITLNVLKLMNQTDLANTLQRKLLIPVYQKKLKSNLREKCKRICEGISQHGSSALLNEIFTELYITEGWSEGVNDEHEVRQIEATSRRPAVQEIPIKCTDLFKDTSIRTVLTKGIAGIGKTVSVQKFILDWAEGKANQDVVFIFPLPFRELNLMKQENLSLMELLHQFFPEVKGLPSLDCDAYKVLFIFDGLDECRIPLDFQNNERLCNITKSLKMDVLLTNLIKGNLLPSAHLWITTRPGEANQITTVCVAQLTEVRGFSDPQKETYFRKRISDENLASKIITHMKSSRSLYIMCHIPFFCWISASVLERILDGAEEKKIPKTLTQMFTYFLIFQIKHKEQKYHGKSDPDPLQTSETILALGKLAFQQMEKVNLIFYEEDLTECGIDVKNASVYSGVCTQIFIKEAGLHLGQVFSFVHLSVQEFLAALYVFLTFINKNRNVLVMQNTEFFNIFRNYTNMSDFLKSAVDKALQSKNGHLDLFLRFLLGLSLESNQNLLRGLLPQTGSSSYNKEEMVKYIKEKISENPSPEKSINLFHCLNELNDDSLVQEVQQYLNREGSLHHDGHRLSPAQWSALVFVLLNSDQELDEFDLRRYYPSHEGLLKLLPVVKESRKAEFAGCSLTEESCEVLSSVLSLNSSSLKHLDLSNNELKDSGVKLLSAGLENPHCKLEILWFAGCSLTEESCEVLSSVLSLNSSSLKHLNLNNNELKDSGVKLLSAGLENPHCKLEILWLCLCSLTEESCEVLSSVLSLNSSSLKHLDLRYNKLKDSGVKLLSAGLENPHCTLEILELCLCDLTEESCEVLSSVLSLNSSSLKHLNLNQNKLKDSGVKLLSAGLENPHCTLEILWLNYCSITDEGFTALASALKSNPSSCLRELQLSHNNPGESGVKLLKDLEVDPQRNLKELHEIRIGHSISDAEKNYVKSRKRTVLNCLQEHSIPCTKETTPNIAVLGSGGGLRAMVALLGSLGALNEVQLLDSVTYLSGVSGSTWCMASLYKEQDWSTKLETVKPIIANRLTDGEVTWTEQLDKLVEYYQTNNYSLTHVWAVFISGSLKEIDENVLTRQRRNHTKDPYPIYTVIDQEGLNTDVWFEITPHESGYSLSGAFVNSSCLGCKFKNGTLIKKQSQMDMLYLQGLCGSALAERKEILKWLRHYLSSFTSPPTDLSKLQKYKIDEHCWFLLKHLDLNLRALIADEDNTSVHISYFKSELLSGGFNGAGVYDNSWILSETPNSKVDINTQTLDLCKMFMSRYCGLDRTAAVVKALQLAASWTWGTTYNFLYNMEVKDVPRPLLKSRTRQYKDAGLLLNSSYISVLRKERNIDLIISLDFSDGDPFETVEKAAKMCEGLNVSFPKVHIPEDRTQPRDFYVCKGYSKAPTVIHIPLFNTVNCPGAVKEWKEKYPTTTMHYTAPMISDLLEKAALNIRNNKKNLLNVIKEIVQEKKQNNASNG